MPLETLPTEVLLCVLRYMDNSISQCLKLAAVSNSWKRIFLSDLIWQEYNVYDLESNIAAHFLRRKQGDLYKQLEFLITFDHNSTGKFTGINPVVWELWLSPAFTLDRCSRYPKNTGAYVSGYIPKRLLEIPANKFELALRNGYSPGRISARRAALGLILSLYCPFNSDSFYFSTELQNDRSLILLAVSIHGPHLRYASDLRSDRDIVQSDMSTDIASMAHASKKLRQDLEFLVTAITMYGERMLRYATEDIRSNKAFMMKAVTICSGALRWTSWQLTQDTELALRVVSTDGRAIQYVAGLTRTKKVVLAAVSNCGLALEYVPRRLQGDREITMAAVTQNGKALQFASLELRADPTVVLAAIKQCPEAVKFARGGAGRDWEVVSHLLFAEDNATVLTPEQLRDRYKRLRLS